MYVNNSAWIPTNLGDLHLVTGFTVSVTNLLVWNQRIKLNYQIFYLYYCYNYVKSMIVTYIESTSLLLSKLLRKHSQRWWRKLCLKLDELGFLKVRKLPIFTEFSTFQLDLIILVWILDFYFWFLWGENIYMHMAGFTQENNGKHQKYIFAKHYNFKYSSGKFNTGCQ